VNDSDGEIKGPTDVIIVEGVHALVSKYKQISRFKIIHSC